MSTVGGHGFSRSALWLALALALSIAACQGQDGAALAAGKASEAFAPAAPAERSGVWRGGPEPVSGKLRSGITAWWRTEPAQPRAGEPFELQLRLEDVQEAGSTASVTTGDGARLAKPAAPTQWALRGGEPAQLSLQLVAPPGASYVYLATQQRGRSSVRSILLTMPGAPAASAAARGDYGTDARGEPIVRMPSATP